MILAVLPLAGCGGSSAPESIHAQKEPSSYDSLKTTATPAYTGTYGDYVQVGESDTYRLYYFERTLSILLENKKTGAILESTVSDEMDDGKNNKSWTGYMKSGLVIYAIKGTTNTYQVDLNTCKNSVKTAYYDNGFRASVWFDDYSFGLDVQVLLEGDELVVRVPEESIVEKKEGTYISTVSLFPMLGYTYLDSKPGYMLLPDGNGALIYLNDKEGRFTTGFSGMVYGTDAGFAQQNTTSYLWNKYEMVTPANTVLMPVFGMAHTDDRQAYLAVIEGGDERCSVECQPNGVMIDYNRCFAKFLLRDVFTQPLNNSNSGTVQAVEKDRTHMNLQVRYLLLSGGDADYSGMARAYRDYLLDGKQITTQDCTYRTRIDFLGSEREKFLMSTAAVPMTTVDDMEEIYTRLRENGVSRVLTVYKGWQDGGLYDLPITSFKADGKIGGTGDLTRLMREQAEKDYLVYLYNDALTVNSHTNSTTFNVMKMVNKRTYQDKVRGQVYQLFYNLMPNSSIANVEKVSSQMAKKDIPYLALAGITDQLFSYSAKGSYYTRTDTMASYDQAVSTAAGNCSLMLESPNAYLWKYAAGFLDTPLGTSDYPYIDQEVPFLAMVLKGVVPMYSEYVNFEANKTETFLQMVETGIYPSFYLAKEDASKLIYTNSNDLYSLSYDTYANTIREYDEAFRTLADKTAGAQIVQHQVLPNGLTKVVYSNGTTVYVNYTGNSLEADGVTVDAQSYKVGDGNG